MPAPTAARYVPGDVIAGKYEVEALLGHGGMGAVFRARNLALEVAVAIKVVRWLGDRLPAHGRLLQEARAAAKLSHPNIVKVFDVGETDDGQPFIVMELLVGQSLGGLLSAQGALSPAHAVRLLLPIVDALWLAHGKGIVHRDLKPDNVFVVEHDAGVEPKLLDFGIVKLDASHGDSALTDGGTAVGSPDYMSPEQARGQADIDLLSDVWSFSVMLYEVIAGRTPFSGSNYNALMRQIQDTEAPSLLELGASDAELSAIVARGMSKAKSARFASMGELGRALARWLLSRGITEDIGGATLESRWLRSDSHVRGARSSVASIHDAWPAESASGVRKNDPDRTPSQPWVAAEEKAPPASTGPRQRTRTVASLILVLLFVVLGVVVARPGTTGSWSRDRAIDAAGAAVPTGRSSTHAAPSDGPSAQTRAVFSTLASEPPAPAPAPPASHRSDRGRGAAPLKRAPRVADSVSGSSRLGAAPRPDDLLSPYP